MRHIMIHHCARAIALSVCLVEAFIPSGVASAQQAATLFKPTGVSGGGDLVTSSINPFNTDQIYIGCDMMGMYRSMNQGRSWSLIPSSTFSATIRSKMSFTSAGKGMIQFAIRKSSWANQDRFPCVSNDGGITWKQLSLPPDSSSGSVFGSLFADPAGTGTDIQRLILEDYQKIWFTRNGGAAYSLVFQVKGDASLRIAGVFWDGEKIYLATNRGLHVSTDNGKSWTLELAHAGLPAGSQIIEFCGAINPATKAVSFFAIPIAREVSVESWTDFRQLANASYLGLYKLDYTNAKSKWVAMNVPAPNPVRHVAVATNDSRCPWVCAGLGKGAQVLKSLDGGTTWTNTIQSVINNNPKVTYWSNQNITTGYQGDGGIFSYHWGDLVTSLDVAAHDPKTVIVTGSMPYVTTDGGGTWRQAFVTPATENPPAKETPRDRAYGQNGLNVTTGHWIHWIDQKQIFIASTDIGNQFSADGGATWSFHRNLLDKWGSLQWGNYYCIARQPGGSRLYAAVSDTNDIYEPDRLSDEAIDKGLGDVLSSDDNGVTWQSTSGTDKGLPSDKFPGPVVWLAVDPNPARASWLYASVAHSTKGGIYLTKNDGATWIKLPNPPRTHGHPFTIGVPDESGKIIASFSASKDASGNLTESSGVFSSHDFGATWNDLSSPEMRRFTKDVSWSKGNPSVLYAAVQGGESADGKNTGTGGLYRSKDGGKTWRRVFRNEGCQSATVIEGNQNLVYVTTAADGLFVSCNATADKPIYTKIDSFPFARAKRVFADPAAPNAGKIWVLTQGGGVYLGTP